MRRVSPGVSHLAVIYKLYATDIEKNLDSFLASCRALRKLTLCITVGHSSLENVLTPFCSAVPRSGYLSLTELELELSVWKQAHSTVLEVADRDKKAHNAQIATLNRQISSLGVLKVGLTGRHVYGALLMPRLRTRTLLSSALSTETLTHFINHSCRRDCKGVVRQRKILRRA